MATRLGVISGAGPDAGVDLLQKVLLRNRQLLGEKYQTDRDAPYVVLMQVPGIGGPRGEKDLFEVDAPPFQLVWNSLTDTILSLEACRVERFCISCNTLHILEDRIQDFCQQQKVKAQFVSMIDCVLESLKDTAGGGQPGTAAQAEVGRAPSPTRVAIFGSLPVTDVQVASPYKKLGETKTLVSLDLSARQRLQALIGFVKKNGTEEPHAAQELESLIAETDAEVVVLACTELPLLLPRLPDELKRRRVLIDPAMALADELLAGKT